jgi:hypothetical protein
MKTKTFWTGLCLLMLTACGPMIGGMMVSSNGIKAFQVLEGDLSDLSPGNRVAVLGPFDKTSEAFYICRGEDAAAFASAFNQTGLFMAELAIDTRFPDELPQASQFKGRTPADLQKDLGLEEAPDLIMSGTIMKREMIAAPANGVIMTATYRLEFINLGNSQTTVIEVTTKELFQDLIPETVEHLAKKISGS